MGYYISLVCDPQEVQTAEEAIRNMLGEVKDTNERPDDPS